jgi:hypothetical protein
MKMIIRDGAVERYVENDIHNAMLWTRSDGNEVAGLPIEDVIDRLQKLKEDGYVGVLGEIRAIKLIDNKTLESIISKI